MTGSRPPAPGAGCRRSCRRGRVRGGGPGPGARRSSARPQACRTQRRRQEAEPGAPAPASPTPGSAAHRATPPAWGPLCQVAPRDLAQHTKCGRRAAQWRVGLGPGGRRSECGVLRPSAARSWTVPPRAAPKGCRRRAWASAHTMGRGHGAGDPTLGAWRTGCGREGPADAPPLHRGPCWVSPPDRPHQCRAGPRWSTGRRGVPGAPPCSQPNLKPKGSPSTEPPPAAPSSRHRRPQASRRPSSLALPRRGRWLTP